MIGRVGMGKKDIQKISVKGNKNKVVFNCEKPNEEKKDSILLSIIHALFSKITPKTIVITIFLIGAAVVFVLFLIYHSDGANISFSFSMSSTTDDNNEKKENEIVEAGIVDDLIRQDDIMADAQDTPVRILDEQEINSEFEIDDIATIESPWAFGTIPEYVMNATEESKVDAYRDFFEKIILERAQEIESDEEITQEYIDHILQANEIFTNYDENADYDVKNTILSGAADQRSDAKEEYRQCSNEQILANWYALCGKNYYDADEFEKEFEFYNYAINMYIDSYAVSLVKKAEPKIIALDYVTTCFSNIYSNVSVSYEIRMEALYCAAAFDNMYLEKLLEYYGTEKPMTQQEHGCHMDLGEIYIWICKEVPDEYKYMYYELAYNQLTQCPQYAQFGKKLGERVYGDLMYLTQYCLDNIKPEFYPDGVTKASLQEQHDYYENLIN